MKKSNLQFNLEIMLAKKNIEVFAFCDLAGINEYELELLLNKSLISCSNPTLIKIAKALKCSPTILLAKPLKLPNIKKKAAKEEEQYKELLPSFSNIDIDLFSESVAKVDAIISSEGKKIDSQQKAKAYLAFYELAEKFME